MKKELNLLAAQVAEELSKYIYFLLAATGAAIAYALVQAEDEVFSKDLIPLIFALLTWCGSFYFGVCHLHLYRQHMIENAMAILYDETFEQMQNRLEPFLRKMEYANNQQYRLFVVGVFLYILWRFVVLFNT
ncbi:MAG: hypothetical protein KDF59_11470 [Nitrosomonas sp.]|nr:hypothetical protein [Nitrosomonas sp.]